MSGINFSVFTSKTRSPMGKSFTLVDGHLQKQTRFPARATVQRSQASSLFDFVHMVAGLGPNQAFSLGCCEYPTADVFTQKEIPTSAGALPAVARNRKFFSWPAGKGIILLDYDPVAREPALTAAAVVKLLKEAVPELRLVTIAQKVSSSSCLSGPDGLEIAGVRGQHFLIVVDKSPRVLRKARKP